MSDTAYACDCETPRLKIVHQFGAQVYCDSCKTYGPWVRGSNYQREHEAAIRAWNDWIMQPPEGRQQHEAGWKETSPA